MSFKKKRFVNLSYLTTLFLLATFGSFYYYFSHKQFSIPRYPKNESWALKIKFKPTEKFILGIPISQINPNWDSVIELKDIVFPKKILNQISANNHLFFISGDFNADNIQDFATVGVYKKNKTYGRFLLILTKNPSGGLAKSFLSEIPNSPGYLALYYGKYKNINMTDCVNCDHFGTIRWLPSKREYVVE